MSGNPFTPNFGQIPFYIAGRDFVIHDITRYLDERSPGDPARSSILIGARGTGKTALMAYLSEYAQGHGWVNINVACIKGLQADILGQSQLALESLSSLDSQAHLTGITLGQFGITWEHTEGTDLNWRIKMTRILDALDELDSGIFLTIDEVNPGLEEMVQLASIYQLWIREGKRIAILMAGLPGAVSALLNDKSVSFLRRSTQYELERINDYEIEMALKKTVEESGKHITVNALQAAVEAIGGFPYMLQLVGYRAWQAAGKDARITRSSMEEGIRAAKKDFETRVLRATIDELSDTDREFLYAMLPDTKETSISDLEHRMNKSSGYISRYRGRLLVQGVITSRRRGYVEFALPGLREYLQYDSDVPISSALQD